MITLRVENKKKKAKQGLRRCAYDKDQPSSANRRCVLQALQE